ncbi:MAG: hypothetical protein M1832_001980 [Thelocarpon impressellum]|nr:MAG: hypothetical protein M1832_001980 [Thelocarpon impressellum]
MTIRAAPARRYSQPAERSEHYGFEDAQVKRLVAEASAETVLIDVREPAEFAAGAIPGAINVPITSAPDALSLPPDEFEERFGVAKPDAGKQLVFYCLAGVRSATAVALARRGGYERVGDYAGSWQDWEKRGGVGGE